MEQKQIVPVLNVSPLPVLIEEPIRLAVRTDSRQPRQRFREVAVERRPQECVDSLQLSRTGAVEHRSPDICDGYDGDGDEEPREDDRNEDDGTQNAAQSADEHTHRISECVIDGVDILRKSVHDTTEGLWQWVRGGDY